jgi:hypothetical protein
MKNVTTKGAMPTDSAFWLDLKTKFQHKDLNHVQALNVNDDGHWNLVVDCKNDGEAAEMELEFRGLAERAGIESGAPDRNCALDCWINLIAEGKRRFAIKDIAFLSAKYCSHLANDAFALEKRSQAGATERVRPVPKPKGGRPVMLVDGDKIKITFVTTLPALLTIAENCSLRR